MHQESRIHQLREEAARAAEMRPEEMDLTDEELFARHPLPQPLETPISPETPVAVLVRDAPPADTPRYYGPITITAVYPTKMNAYGRNQASAQARITINGKEERLLVSGFGYQLQTVEDLQVGAEYELKGIMRRKFTLLNGEKTVSFFLNLTA